MECFLSLGIFYYFRQAVPNKCMVTVMFHNKTSALPRLKNTVCQSTGKGVSILNVVWVKVQKFPKSCTFETPISKLAVCPLNIHNFNFNGQLSLDRLYINRKTYYNLPNSGF